MKGKANLKRPRKEPKEFRANLALLQNQKQSQLREDKREIQRNRDSNSQHEMEEEKDYSNA